MVMEGDTEVIEAGGATDFDSTLPHFAATVVDRVLHDGDRIVLGGITLTAHKTAGHTRGCTTWTMQTRVDDRTLNVVIVGGWSPGPGVRLVASQEKPAAYPGIAADFERTFIMLKALPCDIFLGAHGSYFDLAAKLHRLAAEGPAVWMDASGYREAVRDVETTYRTELAAQRAGAS